MGKSIEPTQRYGKVKHEVEVEKLELAREQSDKVASNQLGILV